MFRSSCRPGKAMPTTTVCEPSFTTRPFVTSMFVKRSLSSSIPVSAANGT